MRRSVTIAEGLVAVLIATFVLGAAIFLLTRAARWMQRSDARVDPRDRAVRALFTIRSALTDAWAYSGSITSPRLSFLTPVGRGLVTYDPDKRQLTYIPPGRTAADVLIPSGVIQFDARGAGPGFVQVSLAMERPAPLVPLVLSDVVLVPFLMRDSTLPWRRDLSTPQQVEIR